MIKQTPLGKQLEVKDYITAKERFELRRWLAQNEIDLETDDQMKRIEYEEISNRKIIELVVIRYDNNDDKKTIYDTLLDAPTAEYDFVRDAAIEVFSGQHEGLAEAK